MKVIMAITAFLLVLGGHFISSMPVDYTSTTENNWAPYTFDKPQQSRLLRYISAEEYWLGLSYGMAAAFAAFCLTQAITRRRNFAATTSGLALSGFLGSGICFFTGCCGSPMLPIYLSFLGPKFIAVTKPLTFVLTLTSISIGAGLMFKRKRTNGVNLSQIQAKIPVENK